MNNNLKAVKKAAREVEISIKTTTRIVPNKKKETPKFRWRP